MRAAPVPASRIPEAAAWMWIGLVIAASILLSRAFACAMPFAALATLAAFAFPGRRALALVLVAWIANQLVGFGLLHYPWTPSTLAWGAVIGVAALAGLAAAWEIARRPTLPAWVALPLAGVAAFAAYEMVLYAATWGLPSGAGAFAPMVVARIFGINAAALGLLLTAQRIAFAGSARTETASP